MTTVRKKTFSIAALALICGISVNGLAQDRTSTAIEPVRLDNRLGELDRKIEESEEIESPVRSDLKEAQKELGDLDLRMQALANEVNSIMQMQQKLMAKLQMQKQAAQEAKEKTKKAQTEAEAARKIAEQKQKEAEAAKVAAEKAEQLPVMTVAEIEKLSGKPAPLQQMLQEIESLRDPIVARIDNLNSRISVSETERKRLHGEVEELLKSEGKWVSFTDEIAPVVHSRCVVCHNARNAKGQYNMSSYRGLMSAGESGKAITPGDADFSLICTMIEDGSMPKDADPLTPEQIEKIKKWVRWGARIESDVDHDALLFRIMPRKPQPQPPETYLAPIPITAMAVHPEKALLATSGYHEVLLWSIPDEILIRRIANVAERVYGLEFHPDGKRIAVASGTPGQIGEVKIFDVDTAELTDDLFVAEDAMFSITFSPDGSHLAASGADGTIAMFTLESTDQRDVTLLSDHSDWVNSIDFSNDGKWLVSSSRDKTAKVFDVEKKRLQITFNGHGANVTRARFLPNCKQVISIGEDRHIRVWEVENAKQVHDVKGLSKSSNLLQEFKENLFIVAAGDGALKLFDAAEGSFETQVSPNVDWISSGVITPDHSTVYVGNLDGQIVRIPLNNEQMTTKWIAIPDRKLASESEVSSEDTK